MSTAGGTGGGLGGDRPGLSKFIRRASKALKPRSARNSVSGVPEGSGVSQTSSSGAVLAETQPRAQPSAMMGPMKQLHSSKSHMKLREEKARTLFAKYGMTLEPGEWTTPVTGTTQWVEKKVVMRVHRQCHRCQTTFGADKLCSNCTHTRCKKCPRFPTKKPKEHKKDTGFTIAIDSNDMAKDLLASLSMPSRFERENVRRQPVQRVRRTCHKCFTLFKGKANQCEDCKHQRCPQCPREPPKLKKHPNGYPGDVEETFPLAQRTLRSPRTRFRWECHTCYQPFIEHEKVCRGCQHERCNQCPRKPPKKVRAQPDPEVVRSVEEKMAKMGLNAPAPAAAA